MPKFLAGEHVIWTPSPYQRQTYSLPPYSKAVIKSQQTDDSYALIETENGLYWYTTEDTLSRDNSRNPGPSGVNNEVFTTGAQRDSRQGKGRFDLITPEPDKVLALVLEAGADKYGDRNWEKGMPFSRVMDSLQRHLNQFMAGDDDEDHLGHALANLWFLVTFRERVRKGKLSQSLADMGPTPIFTPKPGPQGLPDTVREGV